MPSVTRAAAQTSRQNRRDAMQQRLLAAAERLVGDGVSFTELSVERLAAEAGISRSTFYVHFQDKTDIVLRLTRTVLTELRQVSNTWWAVAEHARPADLRQSLAAIIDVYRHHGAGFTVVAETSAYDADVAQEMRSLMQAIVDDTRAAIERGQAAGVMRTVRPTETATVLTWMVERAGYQMVRRGDPSGDPAIVDTLTDIIWTTLYRTPAEPE
jgi:AcrR family transcriptional regulator